MRKNYSTGLLTAALAIILSANASLPALAAGGAGGKGAGLASGAGSAGTTNTTTAGGGGGVGAVELFSGTVGGSGGGGAGSTGGDGGQSLILVPVGCCAVATSPNGVAAAGGATPGASGGNGADGSDITRTTGGGGGGGAHGTVLTTTTTDAGATGGNGGNGGIGGFTMGGGGGGAAGYGAVIDGSGLSYTNTGTVAGGTGGAGGDASHFGGGFGNGGNGGDGGIGVYFTGSGTLNNSGSITGGAGGAGGSAVLAGGTNGAAGTDGAGVVGSDLTIVNSGSITGGGTADAITFTGGTNSLTLEAGSTISGNVDATLGIANTLALGGATNSSFNIGNVGAAQQYRGFNTLAQTGSATWAITGSNTSGLGWNLNGGTLSISSGTGTELGNYTVSFNGGNLLTTAAATLGQDMSLAGNGSFDNGGNNDTLSGVISGTGAMSFAGAGTTTLTGTNTYTGGTTVSAGILQSGAAGAFVDNTAYTVNGGTLDLNGNDLTMSALSGSGGNIALGSAALTVNQGTYAGAISGTGSLTKAGAGILTLTGANTYTGGTTVSAGTLQGDASSLQGAITNNAAVSFNQVADGTYAGAMSGTGSLTKSGTGILILNGINTYTGTTAINGGTLEIGDATHPGATIASNVTVGSGATLRGHGTVTGFVNNSGSLRPGGSIGTLTVNGGVTFSSGSSFDVDVSPDASSLLNVTGAPGTATINSGASVNVLAAAGNHNLFTQYTILTASGGVGGTFGSVNSNLAFLTPSLSYDANNVYLTLARNNVSFATVATTGNQRLVASALEAITAAGATGDMQTQLNTVFGLSSSQAQAAYDSLSGTSLNYVHNAQLGFMDGFANIIGRHVEGGAGGDFAMIGSPILLAAADTTASDVLPDYGFRPAANRGAWVQAYGNNGRTRSDGNAPAYDLSGGGLAIGIDRPLDNGWRVGAALAYGQQRFLTNAASGTTDGAAIAAYGHYTEGPWAVKLLASAGQTHNRSDRSVVLGATNRIASASFNGTQQSLYAESGYTMTMHELDVQPVAALAYTHLRNPAYAETGAGALSLNVAGQSRDSLRSYLGARMLKRTGDLRIEPRLIWTHQFGNIDSAALAASFAGSPGNAFAAKGVDVSRDGAQLGLRLVKSSAGEQQTFYLDVSAEASNRHTSAALAAGMQLRW